MTCGAPKQGREISLPPLRAVGADARLVAAADGDGAASAEHDEPTNAEGGEEEHHDAEETAAFEEDEPEQSGSLQARDGLLGRPGDREPAGEQAAGQAIRGLFAEAGKKAQPQDTLVIYLAGHGDTVGEEWYFIPHDVTAPETEQELRKGGISNGFVSESIKQCRAQKVFVMIDACKSGRLVLAMRSTEARKALVQLARSTGTYIVSASTDQQYAAEIKALGHGVFTYSLLEGLRGKAGERKVTVEGLIHYVKEKLPELTEKHRGQAQYPVSWGSGMDFPLALH